MNSEIEQVYSRLTPSRWQKGVKLLDRFLYETSPVSLYHAMLDKMRVLQRLTLSDRLFHELLAKAIRERVESHLSPVVCSYRRGMGRHTVFQGMAEFLKTYKARVRDPKARRLFVLRMDVSSYTDNIPVGEAAPVWKMLAQTGFRENSLLMKNLKRALRPVVIPESGLGNFCQWIGIPTGSPLTPILANLYLNEFDREMSAVPGAFYRRYGDDMIFIHEDERQFLEIRNAFPARLKKLGLQVKTEKVRSIAWTASGARYGDHAGSMSVDLLGMRFTWNAGMRLPPKNTKEMLDELFQRMVAALRFLGKEASSEDKTRVLCRVSEDYFSPNHPFASSYLSDLIHLVKDEAFLQEVEKRTAKIIVELVTGMKTGFAFRTLSWNDLIKKFLWCSPRFLIHAARKRHDS